MTVHLHELPRGFRELARIAVDQGWRIERAKRSAHFIWLAPDGRGQVVTSGTPSDRRALANTLSLLRRNGLVK